MNGASMYMYTGLILRTVSLLYVQKQLHEVPLVHVHREKAAVVCFALYSGVVEAWDNTGFTVH